MSKICDIIIKPAEITSKDEYRDYLAAVEHLKNILLKIPKSKYYNYRMELHIEKIEV